MTDLSPTRWQRIASLFDQALQLPEPDRSTFLERECGGDPELRAEVEQLLDSAARASGFMEKPLFSKAGQLLRDAVEDLEGDGSESSGEGAADPSLALTRTRPPAGPAGGEIGPYRLLQKIGEGGMGEVWLAEQSGPVRRRVALKLIKAGMDTRQIIARFEAERQALALMDHPAIAKVYEAGETPRGLPYFAMEYVPGEPITAYCDRHRLPTPERLELFARVCEGVQHAHQKGIIHRDLKPSNVLVTVVGDRPEPKIIDFGVAKATAQRLTEKTMFTELGVLIGTPEYMSPEQAEMTGLDVDTRTDVYALGVMLYELLTGALPFEPKELRAAGYEEIWRRIREVDPPKPSTRVRTRGNQSTEAARNRRTDPGRLVSRLKGDLDWIVMKTLEKDRTRRYGSPSELAADLARHLHHDPVLAGPPSATYRARKFVRRHRFGVVAASLAVIGLAAFGVTMALQARTIALERDRAERVSAFLVELFRVSDPSEARGNTITAREVLDRGAERIEKELKAEPLLQARLMRVIGRVYRSLGLGSQSEPLYAKSWEILRRILGPENPESLQSGHQMGWTLQLLGRFDEAERILSEILATQTRVLGPDHPDTLATQSDLGVIYERLDRFEESGRLYRAALERRRRILGEDHPDTWWSMNNVAANLEFTGHPEQAEPLYREVARRRAGRFGADHPDTLEVLNHLARVTAEIGRRPDAERLYLQVVEGRRKTLGEEHVATLYSRGELMYLYAQEGRFAEAEALYQELIEIRLRRYGPRRPGTLALMLNMGEVYRMAKRYEESERLSVEAYQASLKAFGEEHPLVATGAYNLALVAGARGERERTFEWLGKAVAAGFRQAEEMEKAPELESLRADPEFRRLLALARGAGP